MPGLVDRNLFRVPNDTPVVSLNCKAAFESKLNLPVFPVLVFISRYQDEFCSIGRRESAGCDEILIVMFADLTPKERLYAHYIARASFEGSLSVFLQVSFLFWLTRRTWP